MTPCNANAHIADSRFFRHGYATDEARRIFCDLRRMQRWLDVEAMLASCQAELGIIPEDAAQAVVTAAKLEDLDLHAIQAELKTTGHSLIPLLNAWQRQAKNDSGQFIHYGVTTQDIQDTAQSLELAEIFTILERDLQKVMEAMATLAAQHRDLPMTGRTHGQPALPTTLGLKIAGWLDESLRNWDRLQNVKKNVLVSQLFGGVGTMSALSEQAEQLLMLFSQRLGLYVPACSWHNCRDRIGEYLALLALITGGLGRAANEIYELAKSEIGELAEPFSEGQVGSSTMPHKVNPEICEQVVVLARLVKNLTLSGFDGLINEHERDYRAVRMEWVAVTEASLMTCRALDFMKKILPGLVVHPENIGRNLQQSAHLVSTEALMFALGEKLGKQRAHALIYKASMKSNNSADSLLETLATDTHIAKIYTLEQLKACITPAEQVGRAGVLVDQVVGTFRQRFPEAIHEASSPPCPLDSFCRNH